MDTNHINGYELPDDVTIPCPNPNCQKGWVEYDVDYFGRKQAWGRCYEPGCRGGEITIQQEAAA